MLGKVFLNTRDRCAGVLACGRNELFRTHHENVYATRKPACSSLPPYHMLLQAFVMPPKEIYFKKNQSFMFVRCSVVDIFKCDEPRILRKYEQRADTCDNNA
jgi:hypothetical protein